MYSQSPLSGRKVCVVGSSGSGKTTLAERLSERLRIPYLCLDALSHQPHWRSTPPSELRAEVSAFLAQNPDEWIIDGNYYGFLKDITWCAASDIIWLDYPIYVSIWRLFWRSIAGIQTGKELWGKEGCVETWRGTFLSWDSLFMWVVWFYWRQRPVFLDMLVGKDKLEGVNFIWFLWPAQTEVWLERFAKDH